MPISSRPAPAPTAASASSAVSASAIRYTDTTGGESLMPASTASTVSTSLSPRPERPTSHTSPGLALRTASASAWADSSAGMMPSRSHSRWNASSASASVTGSYAARPVSFR